MFMKRENLIMLGLAILIICAPVIGLIGTYFIWRELRKESDYIDRNGYALINFHISFTIYSILAGISMIVLIGFIAMPVVGLLYFIFSVIGLFKYGYHDDYNYPLTINIVNY